MNYKENRVKKVNRITKLILLAETGRQSESRISRQSSCLRDKTHHRWDIIKEEVFGELAVFEVTLVPNFQASFVSKKDAQYRCDKPVRKNNYFPVVFMMELARVASAPFVFLPDPPPLPWSCLLRLWRLASLLIRFRLLFPESVYLPPVTGLCRSRKIPIDADPLQSNCRAEKLTEARASKGQKMAKDDGERANKFCTEPVAMYSYNWSKRFIMMREDTHMWWRSTVCEILTSRTICDFFCNSNEICKEIEDWLEERRVKKGHI